MPPRDPTAVIFDWLMPLHYTSEHHWTRVPHRYYQDARYSAFVMEHKEKGNHGQPFVQCPVINFPQLVVH